MKILAIITLAFQSGIVFAEKYEAPAYFDQAKKPISFKDQVVHKKHQGAWKNNFLDDKVDLEKSKRLPSSKDTNVKYWNYQKKK